MVFYAESPPSIAAERADEDGPFAEGLEAERKRHCGSEWERKRTRKRERDGERERVRGPLGVWHRRIGHLLSAAKGGGAVAVSSGGGAGVRVLDIERGGNSSVVNDIISVIHCSCMVAV